MSLQNIAPISWSHSRDQIWGERFKDPEAEKRRREEAARKKQDEEDDEWVRNGGDMYGKYYNEWPWDRWKREARQKRLQARHKEWLRQEDIKKAEADERRKKQEAKAREDRERQEKLKKMRLNKLRIAAHIRNTRPKWFDVDRFALSRTEQYFYLLKQEQSKVRVSKYDEDEYKRVIETKGHIKIEDNKVIFDITPEKFYGTPRYVKYSDRTFVIGDRKPWSAYQAFKFTLSEKPLRKIILNGMTTPQTVLLSSELCKDMYPKNHGGDFTNNIATPIEVSTFGHESVCLSEIIYQPYSWDNMREGSNEIAIGMEGYVENYTGFIDFRYQSAERIDIANNFCYWKLYVMEGAQKKTYYIHGMYKTEEIPTGHKAVRLFTSYTPIFKGRDPIPDPGWTGTVDFDKIDYSNNDPTVNTQVLQVWLENKVVRRKEQKVRTCKIPTGYYSDVANLFKKINDCIESVLVNDFKVVTKAPKIKHVNNDSVYWVMFTECMQKATVITSGAFMKDTQFAIKLPQEIQHILGFTQYLSHDIGWVSPYVEANPIEEVKSLIGEWRGTSTDKSVGILSAEWAWDLTKNTIRAFWVWCDIIQPNIVNDKMAPLLRIVPVDVSENQISYAMFGNLHYARLNSGKIQKIRIWITEDPDTEPIKFRGEVIVRLQFGTI
jgi:hypothetical protein